MTRRPPKSTLFPSPPLSRSPPVVEAGAAIVSPQCPPRKPLRCQGPPAPPDVAPARSGCRRGDRSEEHTSELQSQSNLVCRLLLEKKKKNKNALYGDLLTQKI